MLHHGMASILASARLTAQEAKKAVQQLVEDKNQWSLPIHELCPLAMSLKAQKTRETNEPECNAHKGTQK